MQPDESDADKESDNVFSLIQFVMIKQIKELKDVILILNNLQSKANKWKLRQALSFEAIVGNLHFSSE